MIRAVPAYAKIKKGKIMNYRTLILLEGIVINVADTEEDCCTLRVSMRTEEGAVTILVAGETYVADNMRLRPGMRVAVFYDGSLPVPLIYPPQYKAVLIIRLQRGQYVAFNYFDRNLLAEDQSLQLNLANRTRIESANGQQFSCSPGNHVLLVFYGITTRSIPPQTTPDRIIVFCE